MLKKKLLFIDDDNEIRNIVKIIFEDDNIKVINIADSPSVADILKAEPDVVLLDELLPGKRGSAVCAALKNDKQTCHIPVILISAGIGLEKVARQCNADAFIKKPFEISHLRQVVKSFIYRSISAA